MTKFEEIGLHPDILRSIEELGFESPTEIQEQAIPAILGSDQDLIALAQTGTGKTAAFGLPLIQQVDSDNRHPQGLILCPTRELAIQIARDLESYSKYVSQLKIEPVYGGTPIGHQIRSLKKGVQIVVATPGRAIDLIGRGALNLSEIQWVVMDEADEMLNMGFQKDLDKILAETPSEKQTLLFSATMPPAISRITKKYMDKPGEISIGTRNSGSKNVTHEFYQVHARDRYEALRRIVAMRPDFYGIVFCRTRRDTKDVARSLSYDGYPSDAIHGDLSQVQRDEVMDKFRSKQIKLLVATDVAARGLDVNELTHVVNFELPDDPEVYIHRSGRTGRAGNEGISLSIIHTREGHKIRTLERMSKQPFIQKTVPTGAEISQKLLMTWLDKVSNESVSADQMERFLEDIYARLADLDREELIQRFVSLEFSRIFSMYEGAPDINPTSRKSENKGRYGMPFTRYRIGLGRRDDLSPGHLMKMLNQMIQNRRMRIGRIKIQNDYSTFEIDSRFDADIQDAFANYFVEGRQVSIRNAGQGYFPKEEKKRFNGHGNDQGRKRKRKRKR